MTNDTTQNMSASGSARCPVEITVALIGGKWKPYVLFNLAGGSKRYSDLKRCIPNVSDRMLSRALRELEGDELVTREVVPQAPVKVVYSLSKDGALLVPVLNLMVEWTRNRLQN